MNSLDTFAQSFDSIDINRKTAPSADVLDQALDAVAKTASIDEPGFYLLDSAQGRFAIDRDTGIVTLADETWLTREFGAVHPAHIKVVEPSGTSYDLKFQLRLTGRVPQMVGAEENAFLVDLAAAPLPDAPAIQTRTPEPSPQPWLAFTAAGMKTGKAPLYGETAPFGTLFSGPLLPACDVAADLGVTDTLPAPAKAIADWTLDA